MKSPVRIAIAALAVAALAAGPVLAGPDHDRLRISLAAWPSGLSGSQAVDGDTATGSSTDFGDVLGLGSEALPEVHMELNMLGPFRMVGSYFTSSFEGEETLGQSVTFDDVVYNAAEQVKSSVDLDFGKVMGSFQVLNLKRVGVGIMLGANLMQLKSQLESATSGQSSKNVTAPLPVVGVNLRLQPFKKLTIYSELSGLSLNAGGVEAKSIDGTVRFEYYFVPWIGITGGFRILDLNLEDEDFGNVDVKQDGAQFGMVFRL